jgi:hypothetical protein
LTCELGGEGRDIAFSRVLRLAAHPSPILSGIEDEESHAENQDRGGPLRPPDPLLIVKLIR